MLPRQGHRTLGRGCMKPPIAPCLGLVLGVASAASATPIPRYTDLIARKSVSAKLPLAQPVSLPLYLSTKVSSIDTKLDVDPVAGSVVGHVDVGLGALGPVGQVSLLLDAGLSASGAIAVGKTISVANQTTQGLTIATLSIAPSLSRLPP